MTTNRLKVAIIVIVVIIATNQLMRKPFLLNKGRARVRGLKFFNRSEYMKDLSP